MCLITTRYELEQITLKKFFQPLLDDIRRFQIPMDLGLDKPVTGYLATIVADNLGSNELAGLTTAFNSDACKSCKIYHKDFQDISAYENSSNFTLLSTVQRRNYLETDHVFREVMRTTHIYTFDPFHDLNEGVIGNTLNAILKVCFKNEEDVKKLNEQITKTRFKHGRIPLFHLGHPAVRGTGMEARHSLLLYLLIG